jgi:ABC-type polysaccharide/polyol phosphate transport system ATPase subunit
MSLIPSGSVSVIVSHSVQGQLERARRAAVTAVSVSDVSKTFRVPREQYHTLKERVLHPVKARERDDFRALNNVSLEIAQGEFFGIVGRNGSGKSTLLKCLAGIYTTNSGEIAIQGRLAPFIELGVGFNPDLAARDNVIINAIMLGLTRSEARARFDSIVEFAELQDFMDLKLKNYSSGMHVRLAFAIAIQVDADVLLIDEVLAVGDAAFQQKCYDEFTRLKTAGRTIVFVTHDMSAIERFCDRAMLIDRGDVVYIGKPTAIARRYNEINFARQRPDSHEEPTGAVSGPLPDVQILSAAFESPGGEKIVSTAQGEPCCVRIDARFNADVENPMFSIGLFDELARVAFVAHSKLTIGPTGYFRAGQHVTARINFENYLAPGRYHLTATISRDGPGADAYEKLEDISSVIVHASKAGGGVVDLPHTFVIEPT